MRRRSFRKPAVTLSLFPFLAVLVCTMGALIVLLVSVLQKARADAATVADAQAQSSTAEKELLEELRLEKEDQEWRRAELERQRTEFQQELTKRRLTLSHFEDHIRKLEEQLQRLASQADELKRLATQQTTGGEDHAEKLRALQAEIERQRAQLTEAQRTATGRKPAFAIIPYEGPNGTRRRPIYIECTDAGVILQPEGVVLSPSDFSGSLGPGNPLDAALRTTREYLAKYDATMSQGEPYPLLIVRPNGTIAYAAARSALKSWDDEFGYELVEAELELAYPKADPALAAELQRSIEDARQRQEVLAAVMPGRFNPAAAGSAGKGLVASSNGGFVALGGASPRSAASRGGTDPAGGSSFSQSFRGASHHATDRATSMQAAQQSLAGSVPGKTGPAGHTPSAPGNTGEGGANADHATRSAASPAMGPAGQSGSPPPPTNSSPSATSSAASMPSFSSGQAGDSGSNRPPSGISLGSANSTQPLAHSRGADWGLPNRGPTATGIQRYLQVECHADRLILLQDRTDYRNPTVIPMPGPTVAAVDPLISALWKRMEQWGVAADGCYWKPVLRVQVQPDAEQRFAELATLLDSSGLVVERKNP